MTTAAEGFTVLAQPHAALRGFTRTISFVGNEATDENRANAHLIAAAPDLLEVAKRCLAIVEEGAGMPNWDRIRAVIRRAEGRIALSQAKRIEQP